MKEKAEIIDLGFVIADGEEVKYSYTGESLTFEFVNWQEQSITVKCSDVVGFKYQWAVSELLPDERFDSTHLIHNSKWLAEQLKQDNTIDGNECQHYRLNFNAAGVMEVLCSSMEII